MLFNQDPSAEKRAEALLIALSSNEQQENLRTRGWLAPVRGSAGGIFGWDLATKRIIQYQVYQFGPDGMPHVRLCAVLGHNNGLPLLDHVIAVKLLIENDEPEFRRVAIVQWDMRIYNHHIEPAPPFQLALP